MIDMKLSIVTIGAFVASLNEATKYISKTFFNKDITKFIPICSVVYGILLALVGYFFVPESDFGTDIIEAIIIGISAGSASTGIHQIGRQISKDQQQPNGDTSTINGISPIQTDKLEDESDDVDNT